MASTTVKHIARDQKFLITLSGLMPLTVHFAYIDGKQIASSSLKPVGGSLGGALKTDRNGQISFDYFYASTVLSDTTPWAEAQKIQAGLIASKRIVVGNQNQSTLPVDYQKNFLSYATTTISVDVLTSTNETTPAAIIKYNEIPNIKYYYDVDIGF